MAGSLISYQLARSLLAIEIEAPGRRHLVKIPANSVVMRTAGRSSTSAFVTIDWQGRTCLVFDKDLKEQPALSRRLSEVRY